METNVQPTASVSNGSSRPWATLAEVAIWVEGNLLGPGELELSGVTAADTSNPSAIAFAETDDYVTKAKKSGVGALLIPKGLDPQGIPSIEVAIPRLAFLMLLQRAAKPWPISPGVHPTAVVDPLAVVDPAAEIGAYAVIERFATVCAGAKVYPFAYIGEDCVVEEGARIGPHVVLAQAVTVGSGSIIQPGAILGADGFGYVWDGTQHMKIPQVGKVVIGSNVEIGALTAIDRAMAGETKIGSGSKLDNLIQVGHNCLIGEHTVIAALTGLSGSTTVGSNVAMGGQCATVDHVSIPDKTSLAGRSAVIHSLTEPGEYIGAPALPVREGMRNMLLSTKLFEFVSRLRKVEKRLGQLEERS